MPNDRRSHGFALWGSGFVVQIAGAVLNSNSDFRGYGSLLRFVGLVMIVCGVTQYAKAKGRNPWWGAFGLFSILGVLVVACLRDYSSNTTKEDGPDEGRDGQI